MDNEIESLRVRISSLTEIDELENENDEGTSRDTKYDDDIPNYEKELQKLFGKEFANRYVHPKIDKSIGVAGMTASLRSQRIMGVTDRKRYKQNTELSLSKIQTNAERLWLMLRENSSCNILKEDSKIDPDLKGSFNAFARGFIGRNMTPPQRSFVEDKELTEMRKKMKSKRMVQCELDTRKKHLMFDLSELQEGNQAMLLSDKSFIRTDGLGIRELLFPPIVEEACERSHEQGEVKERRSYRQMLSDMDVEVVNEAALFREEHREPIGLRFFSESDSMKVLKEKNSFRDQIRRKVGHGDNVLEQMLEKSRRWSEEDRARTEDRVPRQREKSKTVTKTTESPQTKSWQPLTLGAVMDFKITRRPTFVIDDDDGQFRQGACRLWRPKLALV